MEGYSVQDNSEAQLGIMHNLCLPLPIWQGDLTKPNALDGSLAMSCDLVKPVRHTCSCSDCSLKPQTAKLRTAAHPGGLQEQYIKHHIGETQLAQQWLLVLWVRSVHIRAVHFVVSGKSIPCTEHHMLDVAEGLELPPAGGKGT